ncbi:MAG: head-tail connector protein [Alphaproteobacteria bacterium]
MIRERLSLLSAPAIEPVSEAEALAHLRIDSEDELALMLGHIRTARQMVESWTGRALISQGWRWMMDSWTYAGGDAWWDGVRQGAVRAGAARFIEIPKAPLQAVVSVTLFNDADQGVAWSPDNYFADTASTPGRLVLRNTASAPQPQRAANGLQIDFTCGYGVGQGDVPAPLRQAVLMLTAHYFENREVLQSADSRAQVLPLGVHNLLAPYRMMRL